MVKQKSKCECCKNFEEKKEQPRKELSGVVPGVFGFAAALLGFFGFMSGLDCAWMYFGFCILLLGLAVCYIASRLDSIQDRFEKLGGE